MGAEQAAVVQKVIKGAGALKPPLLHGRNTALGPDPVQGQAQHIDAPAGRGVQHGIVFCQHLVAHNLRGDGQLPPQEGLVHNDYGEAGGGHVLLGPGVDQAVAAHIHRPGENVGGHIAHQGSGGLRDILPLGAVDGVVGAIIEVFGIGTEGQLLLSGNAVMAGGGGVTGNMDAAIFFRLPGGLAGEVAGDGIVGAAALKQVHGDGGKLQGGAALEKQNFMTVRHLHQGFQLLLGAVKNLLEQLAAVAHFHDGHAAAGIIQQLSPGLLQRRQGHHGGAGGKVIYIFSGHVQITSWFS